MGSCKIERLMISSMMNINVILLLFNFICSVYPALLHVDPEVIVGRGYAAAPFIHKKGALMNTGKGIRDDDSKLIQKVRKPRKVKIVKSFSEFDDPNGWAPVLKKYDLTEYEPIKQELVSGPPLGDLNEGTNFFQRKVASSFSWSPVINLP